MNNTRLNTSIIKHIKTPIENPLLVSFSLKQSIQIQNDFGSHTVFGDKETYSTNFTHYSNRLNQTVFGNSYKRYGKRLKMLVVIEGGVGGVRYHHHTVIQTPPEFVYSSLKTKTKLVIHPWKKTTWGYQVNDVRYPEKEVGDVEGWIDYISKTRSKQTDLNTSVDWLNTYLG